LRGAAEFAAENGWSRKSRGFPTISSTPCRRSWPSPSRSDRTSSELGPTRCSS
jgi:hypothetical protein